MHSAAIKYRDKHICYIDKHRFFSFLLHILAAGNNRRSRTCDNGCITESLDCCFHKRSLKTGHMNVHKEKLIRRS